MIQQPNKRFRTKPLADLLRDLRIQPEILNEENAVGETTEMEQPETSGGTCLDALMLRDSDVSPVPPIFGGDPKLEQFKIVKTIGARLREARELCNMTQQEAARRLGYSNPSKLAKIEGATDTNSVPLHLIPKAALLYDVSIDFLFGTTDDWEAGIGRDTSQWLLAAWEDARRRDLEVVSRLYRRVQFVSKTFDALFQVANDVAAALLVVRDRNDCFDELRAGSRLVNSVERQAVAVQEAEVEMRRFRAELVGTQVLSAQHQCSAGRI